MKNYTVLIVDNDESSVTLLKDYLSRLPFFCSPVVAHTASYLVGLLVEEKFDLIFADIVLPDLSGVDVIGILPRQLPLVITTTSVAFAAECYDLDIADYLIKPYSFQRFIRAVNRALGVQSVANTLTDGQSIYLKVSRTVQRFDFEAIDFIEAFGIYIKVWYRHKAVVVNETISHLETHLPASRFMRVHKSYIVNLNKVTSYAHANLWVDTVKIPIGALHRTKFEGFFHLLD